MELTNKTNDDGGIVMSLLQRQIFTKNIYN